MKVVVFGEHKRVGIIDGERVIDLAVAVQAYRGTQADTSEFRNLEDFIEGGRPALETAAAAIRESGRAESADGRLIHRLDAVELHAPHVRGARVACAGANFKAHTDAMYARNFAPASAMAANAANKPFIWGFWKVARDATGPAGDVVYPARATRLDYEGEIAVILGRAGKDIGADQIDDYVWGVTIFADWSVRAPREPSGPQSFSPQKNFDTCFSMGPCIVVGELDPMDIKVRTYVNGELRQDFNTGEMTFSFGSLLQHLSRDFTFHPGDVIACGTSAGTAADSSDVLSDGTQPNDRFLKPGDLVRFQAEGIGEINNRIVGKGQAAATTAPTGSS